MGMRAPKPTAIVNVPIVTHSMYLGFGLLRMNWKVHHAERRK
jgi:hypothetical protein